MADRIIHKFANKRPWQVVSDRNEVVGNFMTRGAAEDAVRKREGQSGDRIASGPELGRILARKRA